MPKKNSGSSHCITVAAEQQATACTILERHDRSQTLVAHGFDWDTEERK